MGQFHSTSHGGPDLPEGQVKNDYYGLLGLQWDASEEEIKKAHRKKALELHPDRNYGNVETATKLFAEVQSAYEVLSDPQERAWYDSHREVFLGSGARTESGDYSYNTRMTTTDDIFKLFSNFSPRMEFSDSKSGFYGGLRETFSRLAREEKMACQWENVEYVDYPTFGYRGDSFEDTVRPFYAIWSSFSTKKSFAWKDVHRYSEAPDRRVRRIMEKENRRLREEGIREFNDAVRSLVSFIKKRDQRYKPNPQSEAQRQETLRQSAEAQATRSRAANQAKLREYIAPDWAKSEELQEYRDDNSESEVEHFDCVVCHKSFKSQQQLQAHERSKRHLKAVKDLRQEMTTQDRQLNLQGNENGNNIFEDAHLRQIKEHGDNNRMATARSDCESDLRESYDVTVDLQRFGGLGLNQLENLNINASDNGTSHDPNIETQSRCPLAKEDNGSQEADNVLSGMPLTHGGQKKSPEKMGKAKQKRAKKAAQKQANPSTDLTCAMCHSTFNSKNQLFSHVRELDHAQPLPNTSRNMK
ncbi:putative C2H2 finger domain protein [Aspergillus glaucus CBS 516.65]|uniref:J domain-containing protein n=1 Tax=Aspergillus glaucus CBS 516.65 TaxID=1160497 RepID=A0A1L9VJI0_ASPGL|nr:hypothetical protein ASPGLDRAFT_126653 [Aspergillus glaucus CBS 516.65]OJJ84081.1 hypothetical protein ASPGLDRAFT_126653 [Aspergillus glaucus CBS 516.65]